ncbi:MAG: hypothetical protein VX202_08280 [Pseudomonadota bacterium]|jgi:hypothetical protein|nr:hypothetical protein [Pseudomonadota bacterium]
MDSRPARKPIQMLDMAAVFAEVSAIMAEEEEREGEIFVDGPDAPATVADQVSDKV